MLYLSGIIEDMFLRLRRDGMLSFIGLTLLLGVGFWLRTKIKLLRTLYLPSCVIGGLAGLIIVQTVIYFAAGSGDGSFISRANSLVSGCTAVWGKMPGFLINIVFACLFLGVKLPKFKTLTQSAGPQLAYGQIVAWGQYVIPLAVWILFLGAMFPKLPAMFAGVLEIGFEGGHGTAAGMKEVFEAQGWAAGTDYALTSATFGIISAIIFGMILINWAVRAGHVKKSTAITEEEALGIIPIEKRASAGRLSINSDVMESLSLHIIVIGIAVGIGWVFKQGLLGIEGSSDYLTKHKLLSGFPLFPLCLFGGLIVQIFEERFDKYKLIDLGLIRRIQNTSLDFLVVAAIATIKLNVIIEGLLPLVILAVFGIGWNVFCLLFLARKIFKDSWFERAIVEMGMAMGVTATGLLLLRVVDPDYKTPAAEAFASKQLVHEPIMGGGLWTATAIPLIAIYGPVKVFLIATSALTFWLLIVFLPKLFRRAAV